MLAGGTGMSKADLASAVLLTVTGCKNGPGGGYICPLIMEQEGHSWDDSKARLLKYPQNFPLGRDEIKETSW